jgi:hypothetical protein
MTKARSNHQADRYTGCAQAGTDPATQDTPGVVAR